MTNPDSFRKEAEEIVEFYPDGADWFKTVERVASALHQQAIRSFKLGVQAALERVREAAECQKKECGDTFGWAGTEQIGVPYVQAVSSLLKEVEGV